MANDSPDMAILYKVEWGIFYTSSDKSINSTIYITGCLVDYGELPDSILFQAVR